MHVLFLLATSNISDQRGQVSAHNYLATTRTWTFLWIDSQYKNCLWTRRHEDAIRWCGVCLLNLSTLRRRFCCRRLGPLAFLQQSKLNKNGVVAIQLFYSAQYSYIQLQIFRYSYKSCGICTLY
jgi:hypothetical protein